MSGGKDPSHTETISWIPVITCRNESDLAQIEMVLGSEGIDYQGRNEQWLRFSGAVSTLIDVPVSQRKEAERALEEAGIPVHASNPGKIVMPLSLKIAALILLLMGALVGHYGNAVGNKRLAAHILREGR